MQTKLFWNVAVLMILGVLAFPSPAYAQTPTTQCADAQPAPFGEQGGTIQTCISGSTASLIAGKSIPAGSIVAALNQDGSQLNVTYNADNSFRINETHFWLGSSAENIPMNKAGNPVPGQFPYKQAVAGAATVLATPSGFALRSSPLSFSCPTSAAEYPEGGGASSSASYIVAAHAAMSSGLYGNQSAWSAKEYTSASGQPAWGARLTDKGNWMTYSSFEVYCVYTPPVQIVTVTEFETRHETAFAKDASGRCFDLDGFSRWGWTNGPYAGGTYKTVELWAGAGQCDTSKGELVGSVTFSYNNGQATAEYHTVNGWILNETHFYAGTAPYPVTKQGKTFVYTVAPGQYPSQNNVVDDTDNTLVVGNLSGSVYMIGHAAVSITTPKN